MSSQLPRAEETSGSHARPLSGVDWKWPTCGQIDAHDPHVWSGRAVQEALVDAG